MILLETSWSRLPKMEPLLCTTHADSICP
jgi:hypothetical protein